VTLRLLYMLQRYGTRAIRINGTRYSATVADTPVKRAIGLMFRESLPQNHCMLFVFGSPGRHSVWMRNMRFPLDVLWLNRQGVVIDTAAEITPSASLLDCRRYSPKAEAAYMIELNAGEIRRKGIRTGSKARL
jgi:uncharacterized membrane protein (UPF0127 family)